MVERIPPSPETDPLGDVLRAAADPTRRAILTFLAQHGPARVTEIAAQFAQSLNAISRHIMALEKAGLVRRRTVWRTHMIEIDLAPIAQMDQWFAGLRSIWALRLEALSTALTQEFSDDPDRDRRADPDAGPASPRAPRPRL
jgi:DNA-binding transcriptional ArsR family regulator